MGIFSIDENPAYSEVESKLIKIKNIIQDKDLTDRNKIFLIKKILKNKGMKNNA